MMFHIRAVASLLALCLAGAAQAQTLVDRLATIAEDEAFGGCGCSFAARAAPGHLARGYVFSVGVVGSTPEAFVVFDGSRVSLREIATHRLPPARTSRQYASEDSKVRVGIETVAVTDCTGIERCEAEEVEGTMTLSVGGAPPEKLAIKGVCGC